MQHVAFDSIALVSAHRAEVGYNGKTDGSPCWALFKRLFPNGLDDRAIAKELAPEGWDRSPLLLVYLMNSSLVIGGLDLLIERLPFALTPDHEGTSQP